MKSAGFHEILQISVKSIMKSAVKSIMKSRVKSVMKRNETLGPLVFHFKTKDSIRIANSSNEI